MPVRRPGGISMNENCRFSRRFIRVLLCTLLCAAVIFGAVGCGKSGDGQGSAQTEAEETAMSPEKKAQLQEDQENGLFILVNKDPENHLDPSYVPEDLEPIRYFAEDRNKYTRFMRAEAADAFHRLVEAAAEDGIDIVMTTAYRSYDFQQILWDNYVAQKGEEEANKTSARPGESEHQTGLAVDLSTSEIDYRNSSDFADTKAGHWVAEHAHEYGFILRYPEDKTDITGYSYEPWHIRYVGLTAAADIYENGLTLEEYLDQLDL